MCMEATEQEMSREERRRMKREMKLNKKKSQAKQKMMKKYVGLALAVIVVVGLGYAGASYFNRPDEPRPGDEFPIEGRAHVPAEVEVAYGTNPPTSGDHLATPADWGVYQEELPDGAVVHSLEHGGIWISYKDIDEATQEKLEEIGRDNRLSVIVSPRSANDSPIAVASWGRLMKLDELDETAIREYVRLNKNNSPERLAR